jgi:hypothetical protein
MTYDYAADYLCQQFFRDFRPGGFGEERQVNITTSAREQQFHHHDNR